MERKEADIKRAIVTYLRARGHLVVPYRNAGVYKRETNSYIPAIALGISDLLGCTREGRFFAVEVKRPGNTATRLQKEFILAVRGSGGIGIIAYGIDDVMKAGL